MALFWSKLFGRRAYQSKQKQGATSANDKKNNSRDEIKVKGRRLVADNGLNSRLVTVAEGGDADEGFGRQPRYYSSSNYSRKARASKYQSANNEDNSLPWLTYSETVKHHRNYLPQVNTRRSTRFRAENAVPDNRYQSNMDLSPDSMAIGNSVNNNTERQTWQEKRRKNTWFNSSTDFVDYREKPHVDGLMVIIVLIMIFFGLIMLFSASMIGSLYKTDSGSTDYFIRRQIFFTLMGGGAIWFFTRINIRKFNIRPLVYFAGGVSFLLLFLVLIPQIGIVIQGARRWIGIPFINITFQPSEYTKIFVVFYVAWYYSRLNKRRKLGELVAKDPKNQAWFEAWEEIIKPMIPVAIQLVMISLQAHMSAVVIIITVCVAMMASAGLKIASWLRGALVGTGALAILVVFVLALSAMFPGASFTQRWLHVVTRINIFTDNENVTADQKWQSDQALIAIGSGGVTGVGIGQSRQKYLYLPENHNDYIFSIIAEETGLVGGAAVILLFTMFLFAGILIARRTTTMYSRLIACGYTYLLTLQAFLSIGVNLAILPPTGISLPFFSYGGTSNLFFAIGVGLLLSVSKFDNETFMQITGRTR